MSATSILVAIVLFCLAGSAEGWQPVSGNLTTQWTSKVNPSKPLPEYPRPQMVRPDWLSLNGLWEFAEAKSEDVPPVDKALAENILVPYPIESALSGIGVHMERAWYRRTFSVPARYSGKRLLLHFGAVDWEARVWVNGTQVASHRGGYDAFTVDITDALKGAGPQELVVGVWDPMDPGPNPRGKQITTPADIWFSPVTGIWQTVWLEPVAAAHIDSYLATPDIDAGVLRVRVNTSGAPAGSTVRITAKDGRRVVAEARGPKATEIMLAIPNAALWTPESPHLYDLSISLEDGKTELDAVRGYFGMRKISLMKDQKGVQRLALNNKIGFQMGPLDQGYWPDGLYTAPTDDALKYDIELTKRLGFNMTRKHVKVEPERWYYWCDKLGLLVWQDMPNAYNFNAEQRTQFELELKRLVEGRFNHPSIIMWIIFNEGWGQYDDTPRVTAMVKTMDPFRLVSDASGWVDHKVGDIVDMHKYPGPDAPATEPNRAAVLGEFGGQTWSAEPGHVWKRAGHVDPARIGREWLTRRYEDSIQRAYELRDSAGLSAAVYCEITDVETEVAGLATYDRAVIKGDEARIRAANGGVAPDRRPAMMVVPTSESEPVSWRFTTQRPASGWEKAGFDDHAWKEGPGGFGAGDPPGSQVRTTWDTEDIWLRRPFDWNEGTDGQLVLRLHHDDDVDVWLNGVRVLGDTAFLREYLDIPLPASASRLLKPTGNVLAIHCHQSQGGQYVDAGLGIWK